MNEGDGPGRTAGRRINILLLWTMTLGAAGCGDEDAALRQQPMDSPKLGKTAQVVFATEGDAPTRVDLTAHGTGPFELLNSPRSAGLDDDALILSHARPIHEETRVRDSGDNTAFSIWQATQPIHGPEYPLSISDDGRWIVDQAGNSYLGNGDAPWSIFAQLHREAARNYFVDRATKGVNLVLGRMIEHAFSDNNPVTANRYGEVPFTATLPNGDEDFTSPNEAYWAHVDWLIREAYRYGIVMIAFPAYIGYDNGPEGWTTPLVANGPENLTRYGTFVGERYRGYPNIIWGFGGDAPLDSEAAEHEAMAEAVKAASPAHLTTAKSVRGRSSLDDYDRPWLDINATYAGRADTGERMAAGWHQTPAMPTFLIEGHYGNEHGMSDLELRHQMWQAVAYGGFGHIYGNAPTWYFGEGAWASGDWFADQGGWDWRDALDSFGASFLPHVAAVLAVWDVSRMIPDHAHRFVLDGTAWGTANDHAMVLYTTGGNETVTIDGGRFRPGNYQVTWYDPADGRPGVPDTVTISSVPMQFTSPTSGDHVLLINHASLESPSPNLLRSKLAAFRSAARR